jgi:hypothetical protein
MQRWTPTRSVATGAVVVVLAAGFIFYERPSARMRREVNYWVHGYKWCSQGGIDLPASRNRRLLQNSLHKMGTNAVPYLIEDLSARDTMVDRVQQYLFTHFDYRSRHIPTSLFRTQAAEALGYLGESARPAISALITNATTDDINVRRAAIGALTLMGTRLSNVIATATSLTNHSYRTLTVVSRICLSAMQPTNEVLLHDANTSIAAAATINEGGFYWIPDLLSDLGERGTPFLPGLKAAITNQTCQSFLTEHFGRVNAARALWHLERSGEAALLTLNIFTNAVDAGRNRDNEEFHYALCSMARDLSEVPDFCAVAKPVLERFEPSDKELKQNKSHALLLLDQTLKSAKTNLVGRPIKAHP